MLTFLGFGSAFNTELDNTSAFYKKDGNMLLIDCGGTVFTKLIDNNILDDVKNIWIAITHLHDDHCGSLSSLIFYMYFVKNIKAHVIFTDIDDFDSSLIEILKIQCVLEDMYEKSCSKIPELDLKINFINAKHDIGPAFSLSMKLNNKYIYYSGDTSEICKKPNYYDYIYQEVSFFDSGVHCNYDKLAGYGPFREKIYLMHIDDSSKIKFLKKQGFRIVNIFKKKNFVSRYFLKNKR